jgi:hypothetical protein
LINLWADRGQILGQMMGWGLILNKNNVTPMGVYFLLFGAVLGA